MKQEGVRACIHSGSGESEARRGMDYSTNVQCALQAVTQIYLDLIYKVLNLNLDQ